MRRVVQDMKSSLLCVILTVLQVAGCGAGSPLYLCLCKLAIINADKHNLILAREPQHQAALGSTASTAHYHLTDGWHIVSSHYTRGHALPGDSVLRLTWRTGDGGAALVLLLLHDTVLPNWFDERTNPGTGDNMMT